MGFEILNISYEERNLHVVDLGKLNVLHSSNCDEPFHNTSAKLNRPFKIAPVNLNLIFYNCTEEVASLARQDRELVQTRVRCGNKWEVLVRAGVPHDATGNYTGSGAEPTYCRWVQLNPTKFVSYVQVCTSYLA